MKRFLPLIIIFSLLFINAQIIPGTKLNQRGHIYVTILTGKSNGLGAKHGLAKLKLALEAKGIQVNETSDYKNSDSDFLIAAGLAGDNDYVSEILSSWKLSVNSKDESLLIHNGTWKGKRTLLITGKDDRGLMYALLDAADRISWAKNNSNLFSEIKTISESPEIRDRTISIYTMHKGQFESHFFDEKYWNEYFDMLAKDRFNTFLLIFGYENSGYFAPAYPYFCNVDGYPDVYVVNQTSEQQEKYRNALHRLIQIAHEHGLKFEAGLWDMIYRGGIQGPEALAEKPTAGLVWGLNAKNLNAYIPKALDKFLQTFPELDGCQFRMHEENGLKSEEIKSFWESMYNVMKQYPDIRMECRLKGYSDDLINLAVKLGINYRINTKFWAEHMGMPFHPTHIQGENQFDRRHSYADVLRYPKKYNVEWQVWTGGTVRVLLWGDPDFIRRLDGAIHLYDGDGFEIAEPLATKMASHHDIQKPFELLNPKYQYYKYEFQRYWHFFQLFGRLGYNPNTPAEIWDREFENRFGKKAAPFVEQGLHVASKILPRIEAYCMPPDLFPTTRGWFEKQRVEDLAEYANAEPSDIQQFSSFKESADDIMNGRTSVKISPVQSSRWFAKTSLELLNLINLAKKKAAPNPGKEFFSTMVDLKILSHLAGYHSHRALAGLDYALFKSSNDLNKFDEALNEEKGAIAEWEKIVLSAGDIYADNLMMGLSSAGLDGHWKDELAALKKDLANLKSQRSMYQDDGKQEVAKFDFSSAQPKAGFLHADKQSIFRFSTPSGTYQLKFTINAGNKTYGPMRIIANGSDYTEFFSLTPGQSLEKIIETSVADNQLNISFDPAPSADWNVSTLTIIRTGPKIASVPIIKISPGKSFWVTASVYDNIPVNSAQVVYGNNTIGYKRVEMKPKGNLYKAEIRPEKPYSNFTYWIEAADSKNRRSSSSEISPIISNDAEPPSVQHKPITEAPVNKPLKISAIVKDASGIKWVHLRYRSVNQTEDYKTIKMLSSGHNDIFTAEIPGEQISSTWDFMYFIEVMDNAGNGKIYPDLEKETPYVVVKLIR